MTENTHIELTKHELVIINNCINATLDKVEEWEFPILIGGTVSEAETLLEKVGLTIDKII
jgi:hypothetical protein